MNTTPALPPADSDSDFAPVSSATAPAAGATLTATATTTATTTTTDDTAAAEANADSTAAAEAIPIHRRHYYLIFAASGFAALIYESLWTRYLKIFLGHAAFAQSLVLTIFLFGLAAGAMLAARHSRRIARPLLVYAAIEAVLAVVAVYFHDIFVIAQAWALDDVLPHLGDNGGGIFKWLLAAGLILPQTILLGATFPMLAAGVIRRWRDSPGNTISTLYFSNSMGAAIGVLIGGFVLIPVLGLPGAGLSGGLINAAIAAVVWVITHRFGEQPPTNDNPPAVAAESFPASGKILLLTAAVTGMSSFIYEIVWTRLISLLLGGSTYSFEIMLAMFIFGLAVGSFIIRRRTDQTAEPVLLLGGVQIVMGALALASLPAYPFLFKLYVNFWPGGEAADAYIHWRYFLLGGVVAAGLILPTAICAGMTLPLITRRLMQDRGESALGMVYAANTLGAIIGVYLAVHWLIPMLGVKNAMIIGAAGDLLLGCMLFAYVRRKTLTTIAAILTSVFTAAAVLFGGIPLKLAASGAYRYGAILPEKAKILFYRDGKTASIAVLKDANNTISIRTNGKSDAAINYGGKTPNGNEMTMTMLGLLPLLTRPDARRAANIGFGSGLTSRTLLQSATLERLDNIEIEPVIVAGARQMGDKIAPVFSDRRNHFIFADAKSVFARTTQPYDIIISEPSNPWISGIGGLFTREFYQRIKSSLTDNGVFVQWLPMYETSPQIFASVAGALGGVFNDFQIYLSSNGDAIFVAVPRGKVPPLKNDIFSQTVSPNFFSDYNYSTAADLAPLFIGDKQHLMPYFNSFNAPPNSDYFPYVEHQAPLAFYRKSFFHWATAQDLPVPFMEMANARPLVEPATHQSTVALFSSVLSVRNAVVQNAFANIAQPDGFLRRRVEALKTKACGDDDIAEENYMLSLSDLIVTLMPQATAAQMTQLWALLAAEPCIVRRLADDNDSIAALYTRFWRALSTRNAPAIIAATDKLLPFLDLYAASGQTVMLASMAAHYRQNNHHRVLAILNQIPQTNKAFHHAARFLGALAAEKL